MSEHRHIDATTTRCTDCGTYCTVDRPCYCCLAAEVDDLKARLISALAPAEPSYEELQAQVQRVRELLDSYVPCESGDPDDCVVCAVRRALEGNA